MAASRSTSSPATPRDRDSVHFHLSGLLLIGIVTAAISTVAVVVSAVLAGQPGPPPQSQGGGPPPPPHSIALMISLAFFVVSWVTVAVAIARDQIVHKIAQSAAARDASMTELHAWLEDANARLIDDSASARQEIRAHLETISREYGDERETQGYLNAMRAAAGSGNGDVRPLRTVPRPDSDR